MRTVLPLLMAAGLLLTMALAPPSRTAGLNAHFYITDTQNSRLVRMDDMTGKNWTTFGSAAKLPGLGPMFVDKAGRIYVSDLLEQRLVRMDDMTGKNFTVFGKQGIGTGQFGMPSGICVDAASHIYIADAVDNRIVRMDDMTGKNWTVLGKKPVGMRSEGSGTGEFHQPTDVWVDANGHIYVADTRNNRIVRMDDMTGKNWTACTPRQPQPKGNTPSREKPQPDGPDSVFVDKTGHIYTTYTNQGRIVRMDDMTGKNLVSLGSIGSGSKQFSHPSHVVTDSRGDIYVVDSGNSRIVRMDDMTGKNWTTFGRDGAGAHEFSVPVALCIQE